MRESLQGPKDLSDMSHAKKLIEIKSKCGIFCSFKDQLWSASAKRERSLGRLLFNDELAHFQTCAVQSGSSPANAQVTIWQRTVFRWLWANEARVAGHEEKTNVDHDEHDDGACQRPGLNNGAVPDKRFLVAAFAEDLSDGYLYVSRKADEQDLADDLQQTKST